MLKRVLEQGEFEKLEESVQKEYKQEADGKFHLLTEEDPAVKEAKAQVTEFRTNNITLTKRVEEFEKKYKDVPDLDKIKEMEQKLQLMDDKKLLEDGEIEKLLEQRTERMQAEHANQVKTRDEIIEKTSASLEVSEARLSRVLIDSNIRDAVNSVGVMKQGAITDAVSRGREVWKLVDGEPVPMKADETILYGPDPKIPMTFEEWASGLLESAPFLFEPNDGTGSKGGAGSKGGTGSVGDEIKALPVDERLNVLHSLSNK